MRYQEGPSLKNLWVVQSDGEHYHVLYAKRLPRKLKKLATSILRHNTKIVVTSVGFAQLVGPELAQLAKAASAGVA